MSFRFEPNKFENKISQFWRDSNVHLTPNIEDLPENKKRYILDMFPYPSGAGLHVGHVEGYVASDIYSRYCRMKGESVLHPMGFDSFGLPAENFAIKSGVHPAITTEKAIATFKNQMQSLGLSFDWSREIQTHDQNYYTWTQWLFLLLFKKGLAYRKSGIVNWCPGCQTVLANEQVIKIDAGGGMCERCDSTVIQRDLEQWYFKITEYAERLLVDLEKLDWPESTKTAQRNWIGKSEGIEIDYPIEGSDAIVTVFTTRPETNFGATFIAVAPESDFIINNIANLPNKSEVDVYVKQSNTKTSLERQTAKNKTGVFTGCFGLNRLNGKKLPIYVADFVLGGVGTGALVGVPGHDRRDWDFAKAMGLPVIRVVVGSDGDTSEITKISQVQEDEGKMINSDFLDGDEIHTATKKMIDYHIEHGWGRQKTNFKLRDWLISRQRYWGAPIPMKKNKLNENEYEFAPVSEAELPVLLPHDVEFLPTGKSPLTDHPDFVDREVDTMDTFVDSSWYFLRFCDPKNEDAFASSKKMNSWGPVDLYIGGAEHTVLHLLYSRFITKVLFDAGYINFDEPFLRLRHQGMILGPDGRKMSKRWGNVINPLEIINEYGADTLRIYEMFLGPLADMKAWNVKAVAGAYRFLKRIWEKYENFQQSDSGVNDAIVTDNKLSNALNKLIIKVSTDIEELKYNTAIAAMMSFLNEWDDVEKLIIKKRELSPKSINDQKDTKIKNNNSVLSKRDGEKFLKLLAPFAPFMTEEIWTEIFGHSDSIHLSEWPKAGLLEQVDKSNIAVQINGRLRGVVETSNTTSQDEVIEKIKIDSRINKYLTKDIKRVIFIPGKVINLVLG